MNKSNEDIIRKLIDKIRILEETKKNQINKSFWKAGRIIGANHWRGIPRKWSETGKVPLTVELENEFWSKLLGYDLHSIYSDPVTYLKFFLEKKIKKFEIIDDDTPVNSTVSIFLGSSFEAGLFGQNEVMSDKIDPSPDMRPLIKTAEDVERARIVDFFSSGIMKKAYRYFDVIYKLLDGKCNLSFPEFIRSPFAVAMHIRGMENLLCDMIQDCDFAHNIIEFVSESRENWWQQWSVYFDKKIPPQNLFNDEISFPMISPALYNEFIFPSENKIAQKYGIKYWHSCGDTTELMQHIKRIGFMDVFHVGPWTDLIQAVKQFEKTGTSLEICLHPLRDVIGCNEPEKKIMEITTICNGSIPFSIRADAIQSMADYKETLKIVKKWINEISPLLDKSSSYIK